MYMSCSKNQFKEASQTITLKKHVFSKSRKSASTPEYVDLSEDEVNELENAELMETEASKLIREGDIAVIKTGDDHPYYLLKLLRDPFETETTVSDDYNHEFPPLHRIVEGNYFEIHKTSNEGDIYYIDWKKKAIISAFSVVGICPSPMVVMQKRKRKEQEMYIIDNDLHQDLYEIVNSSDV